MTYVVIETCINCKHTDCVEVCPEDAFHEADKILYINPQACVDCDACASECPEDAIFHENAVPKEYLKWIDINAIEAPKHPVITEKKPSLAT